MVTVCLLATSAHAAAPVIESLNPAGGQRGTTIKLTVAGKFDPWPAKAWSDTPSLKFEPGEKPGQFTVTIAPDAPPGAHLVRFYAADGASPLRCFVVGDQAESVEAEPNDERAKPQAVGALPVTINAQLDKSGDVDCYAVKLDAGQCLVAAVQGRRLGSAIDPILHLFDSAGAQVAFAHDGLGLDPLLSHTADRAGTYVLRVSAFAFPPAADVKLAGGKDCVYRLSLTTGPFVRGAIPSGVTRGGKSTVTLFGWNLTTPRREIDPTDKANLAIPVPGGEPPVTLESSDAPEVTEPRADSSPLAPPINLTGVLAAPGEEDHIRLAAKKGEKWTLTLRPAATASTLDPVFRVDDPAGKLLATDDGRAGATPRLDFAAPADGVYTITVVDRFHARGPNFLYRLGVKKPAPEILATVETDAFALAPGKTTPVKVTITRKNGHAAAMTAVATHLPPGVTAARVDVPAKAADVAIQLTADPDAKPFSGPFHISLLGAEPSHPDGLPATADLRKDADKAGGQSFIDRAADPWLTLSPSATTKPAAAKGSD